MKHFLVCFLLITGCKSGVKDIGNSNVVIGTALNQKPGAVLSSNDEIYRIEGLRSWDSIYLEKKVKVKGHFKLIVGVDKVYIKNFGTFAAQAYPRYYSVSDATWELYDPD